MNTTANAIEVKAIGSVRTGSSVLTLETMWAPQTVVDYDLFAHTLTVKSDTGQLREMSWWDITHVYYGGAWQYVGELMKET